MNTRTNAIHRALAMLVALTFAPVAMAGVEIGETLKLTLRGVPNPEQQQINGDYRKPEHKNFELLPDDTLSVEQRGPLEVDIG